MGTRSQHVDVVIASPHVEESAARHAAIPAPAVDTTSPRAIQRPRRSTASKISRGGKS